MLLQVIGFLLFLADGDKLNINKLKQLNLSQIDTIFKVSSAVVSQLIGNSCISVVLLHIGLYTLVHVLTWINSK